LSDLHAYGEMAELEDKTEGKQNAGEKTVSSDNGGEGRASWMSQMTYEWLSPMLIKGTKQQLGICMYTHTQR
jgi:hypothetical protein